MDNFQRPVVVLFLEKLLCEVGNNVHMSKQEAERSKLYQSTEDEEQ